MTSYVGRLPSFILVLVVIANHLIGVSLLEPRVKPRRTSETNKYDQDRWIHQPQERPHRRPGMSKKDRTHGRIPPTASIQIEGGNGSPPQRETAEVLQPSALKQGRGEFQGFDFPYKQRDNQPPGVHSKRKKHNRDHKRAKDRTKHHRGRSFETEPSGLLKEDLSFKTPTHLSHLETSPSGSGSSYSFSTANPWAINVHPTTALETLHRMRPPKTPKKGGDVTPTLDMALFDWTDYEDMKPDMWPSPKKKGKLREKFNTTSLAEEEPCDHHLDCLPGSCCDLREHLCKPHNRGLNNKCYDDCMCSEGLRCYAKFHRNQRVTRRKGRCVDPESINKDQGSFISV
ncbi:draxin [Pelodytes ibericus]